ncbi:MAG: isoleucine--tRNA ligase [Thermoanaerobaculia bacterium]
MADSFPPLPTGYPFPSLELEVLEEWSKNDVFHKTLAKTDGGERFVFYEGPPTANNKPHIGHVLTRVVKDLLPRYKTMRGFSVPRKAGWDTHGLPVEIEVEKSLGFSGKRDIETYGVERFNRACLESVHTYERQWREMTHRVGFWVDLEDAYFTYSNRYVESAWWALSRLHEKGLLEKGYKIQPYCARCGTTLSSHEVAQNYQDTQDPSVWVLFPVRSGQEVRTTDGEVWPIPEGASLVAWTTTPWTLLGHTGMAAGADLEYKAVAHPGGPETLLIFGANLETPVPFDAKDEGRQKRLDLRDLPAVATIRGSELHGLRYDRPYQVPLQDRPTESPFDPPPGDDDGWRVFNADYVTASEGTGLVHTAPAFGEDDYASGRKLGLPLLMTVNARGEIDGEGTEPFRGKWIKDADSEISRELKERGRLLHSDRYSHNYPFCWRCDQPLLYYASQSWFVRTTKDGYKQALIDKNRDDIRWSPAHVGEGRFGKWLEGLVDWALSRKRYWGTPLPVWECDHCSAIEVVGSYKQLFSATERALPDDPYDREQFDPHRPFVDRDYAGDAFVWPCRQCAEGSMGRVSEVIDAWFDSGAMPFAQHHYIGQATTEFDPGRGTGFPADFISEAVDQTRGWFYTLHVLGVLLFDQVAYRNCKVLGHINDETGRKMSKRLGNVVDPMEVLEATGADALRWYFFINNPEVNSRFSARLVREGAQKFLIPLWNAVSFFTIYANLDAWKPGTSGNSEIPFAERPALDRWILLRLERLTSRVTASLDDYNILDAARELERFVDDLTNWYIRRSRDRFWAASTEGGREKESAYQTLYETLCRLTLLIAPFMPFAAEVLHRNLIRGHSKNSPESVHLEDWPETSTERSDPELESAMEAVQRIVKLGHAARNDHQLKTRQPLASVTVVTADDRTRDGVRPYLDILRQELNVREILWAEDRSEYVHQEVRPDFRRCGPRFGKQMKSLQRTLAEADGDRLAASLQANGSIQVALDGEAVDLSAAELEVRMIEKEGMATQGDSDFLVALDSRLDDDLITEGRAREIINRVQQRRKDLDLDYADRIRLVYRADEQLEPVFRQHGEWIAKETLAVAVEHAAGDDDLESRPIDELRFAFEVEKVNGKGN